MKTFCITCADWQLVENQLQASPFFASMRNNVLRQVDGTSPDTNTWLKNCNKIVKNLAGHDATALPPAHSHHKPCWLSFFFFPQLFPPATMCPVPSPSYPTEVLDPSCRYARRSEARCRSVTAAAACWAPGQLQGGGPLRWGDPPRRWVVRASPYA